MIAKLLYKLSAGLPCRLIHRKDNKPYLERYFLFQLFGVRCYLHRFVDGDVQEQPHDHPWNWALSLVLTGWYLEEYGDYGFDTGCSVSTQIRIVSLFNRINSDTVHAILKARKETWTLFWHGPRVKPWGFMSGESGVYADWVPANLNTGHYDWEKRALRGRNAGRQPFTTNHHSGA